MGSKPISKYANKFMATMDKFIMEEDKEHLIQLLKRF